MIEDDEQPLSDQMKTLFGIKVNRDNFKVWRDLWHIFLIIGGMLFGFFLFGCAQYMVCRAKNLDVTIQQCFFRK